MADKINNFKDAFDDDQNNIEFNTIDGFQGREMDVIILSLVRSNKNSNIGFLKDRRRMNVAITRAKYLLVVIGNIKTLKNDKFWKN
mmetsp:Transcript_63832/g.54136  ORF Transcript_63832/g.54136 Transcript_63832/m.54136 type:complete len:86 (+) Transcript_63832:848-1105(+)